MQFYNARKQSEARSPSPKTCQNLSESKSADMQVSPLVSAFILSDLSCRGLGGHPLESVAGKQREKKEKYQKDNPVKLVYYV